MFDYLYGGEPGWHEPLNQFIFHRIINWTSGWFTVSMWCVKQYKATKNTRVSFVKVIHQTIDFYVELNTLFFYSNWKQFGLVSIRDDIGISCIFSLLFFQQTFNVMKWMKIEFSRIKMFSRELGISISLSVSSSLSFCFSLSLSFNERELRLIECYFTI